MCGKDHLSVLRSKHVTEIMLSAVDGSTFNIADIFMHHGSRKTIVSSNTGQDLARVIDERCIVHDLSMRKGINSVHNFHERVEINTYCSKFPCASAA